MRAPVTTNIIIACISGLMLSGCLISDEPVLNASNGRATPVEPGAYQICEEDEDGEEANCEEFNISLDQSGLYKFDAEDEEPTQMRFRRVGRRGYAAQLLEDDDDTYIYYYGSGDSDLFRLTMMLCADLPDRKRQRLIDKGDLQSDDENFETCRVQTLKGLTTAARIYHRDQDESDEELTLKFSRVRDSE